MSESQILPMGSQSQGFAATPRLNTFTKAMLSIVGVIAIYFALGKTISHVLGEMTVGGYVVMWSTFATGAVAVGAMIWAVMSGRGLASLGIQRPGRIWLAVLQGIVIAPIMMVAMTPVVMGLASLGLVSEMNFNPIDGPNIHIAFGIAMAVMWVNAAIGEEVIFRGLLMNNIQRGLGGGWVAGVAAALIVAVPFGLLHYFGQGWYGVAVTGTVGFMMGLFFLVTKRNIVPVVIAHGVFNSISFIALYASQLSAA